MLLQASAPGGRVQKRRKLWICMWFLISSLIPDTYCMSTLNVKATASHPDGPNNSTDKSAVPSSGSNGSKNVFNKIRRAVPPRVKEEIPKEEQDTEKEAINDEALGYVLKVPIHIVLMEEEIKNKMGPTPIITRTVYKYKNGTPRSEYQKFSKPNRFVRSIGNSNFEGIDIPSQQDILVANEVKGNNKGADSSRNSVLHSRPGSYFPSDKNLNLDQSSAVDGTKSEELLGEDQEFEYGINNFDISDSKYKREDSEYVVPQIRYGRSMILLSSSKSEKLSTEKPPHTFVLPYPRPGRNSEDSNTMIPYPRPGRSDDEEGMVDGSARYIRQGYMVPSARLGRSTSNVRFDENIEDVMGSPEAFLGLKVNPLLFKSAEYKIKDESDTNSNFVIPYPRPGKRTLSKVLASSFNDNADDGGNTITDFALPYPISSKGSLNTKSFNRNRDSKPLAENFILPYPRPGRSYEEVTGESSADVINNFAEKQSSNMEDTLMDVSGKEYREKLIKRQSAKNTMIPYARIGRTYDEDRNNNLNTDSRYQVALDNEYNSQSYSLEGLGNNVLSTRSNSVVPYPRVGRSNTVLPQPRLGRSSSIVPYPRTGRSVPVVTYPRPGRSEVVVPYPRLGRSDSLVPYPRPGRSNSVVPYPRIGKSSSVVPYPRPGRSNSVLTHFRPGRTLSVVPYPRPGRSNSMVSSKRSNSETSYSIVPYPRPGRSLNVNELNNKDPHFLLSSDIFERFSDKRDSYVLPYLRPGRTVSKKDTSLLLPYPRPGRSSNQKQGYVLPHPRIGRSEEDGASENVTVNTVIPYPRLGRSEVADIPPVPPEISNSVHKLNKHMLNNVDESVYLLPYPRPGRFSE